MVFWTAHWNDQDELRTHIITSTRNSSGLTALSHRDRDWYNGYNSKWYCCLGVVWTLPYNLITAHNEVGATLCFLHVSVILFTAGEVVSQHALQVSRPTPRGGEVEGSGRGGGFSRPTPGGRGCIPACTEAYPPSDSYCCRQYASYWNAFLF